MQPLAAAAVAAVSRLPQMRRCGVDWLHALTTVWKRNALFLCLGWILPYQPVVHHVLLAHLTLWYQTYHSGDSCSPDTRLWVASVDFQFDVAISQSPSSVRFHGQSGRTDASNVFVEWKPVTTILVPRTYNFEIMGINI